MHQISKGLVFVALILGGVFAQGSNKLVINAVEFGIAKFHRYDNIVHAYGPSNAWTVFILPVNADTSKPLVQKNDDGSTTIFYSTLEELVQTAAQVSEKEGQEISVLNINGHGMPGAMWFPADASTLSSPDCADWVEAAQGADEDNYNQYYSAISKDDIMYMRAYAQNPSYDAGCVTGLPEWKKIMKRNPNFKKSLAANIQVHFLSCIVGLGKVGKAFTEGMAGLLVSGQGRVETSTYYGLGDWSMPEGMGFWDYQNDEQLERDNAAYPVNKQDREEMQKGIVRVATSSKSSSLIGEQDFMVLTFGAAPKGPKMPEPIVTTTKFVKITSLRIPGTNVRVPVRLK